MFFIPNCFQGYGGNSLASEADHSHSKQDSLLIWARQREAEEDEKIWDMALPSLLTCSVTPAKLSVLSREASMSDSVISKDHFTLIYGGVGLMLNPSDCQFSSRSEDSFILLIDMH